MLCWPDGTACSVCRAVCDSDASALPKPRVPTTVGASRPIACPSIGKESWGQTSVCGRICAAVQAWQAALVQTSAGSPAPHVRGYARARASIHRACLHKPLAAVAIATAPGLLKRCSLCSEFASQQQHTALARLGSRTTEAPGCPDEGNESAYTPRAAGDVSDLYVYAPADRSWTNLAGSITGFRPPARDSHGVAALGGKVYVFGGWNGNGALGCRKNGGEAELCGPVGQRLRHRTELECGFLVWKGLHEHDEEHSGGARPQEGRVRPGRGCLHCSYIVVGSIRWLVDGDEEASLTCSRLPKP